VILNPATGPESVSAARLYDVWVMKRPWHRLLLVFCVVPLLWCQGRDYLRGHYTKYEFRIPMRDGKRLFTAVYVPKDDSQAYPILLLRTPYSVRPYGTDSYPERLGPSEKFAREGFIFALQDVRGRYESEGEFVHVRPYLPGKRSASDVDESSDAYDTVEWLVKHVPNNNGRVGIYGTSYPGFYAAMAAIDAHPALKAVAPHAPVADWFIGDDFRHNGALFLAHAFNFLARFGRPRPEPATVPEPPFEHGTPDGYQFFLRMGPLSGAEEKHFKGKISFWRELLEHDTYDDFWKARSLLPHLKNIRPAVLTVGGWFDAEDLYGPLNVYRAIEQHSPGAWNALVMGPWDHGGWNRDGDKLGPVSFGSKTSEFFRDEILLPFFNHYLKGKGELKLPEAYVFETGTNQWRKYDAWPPRTARGQALYLREGGRLAFEPPANEVEACDEYVSDPGKPVPFIGSIEIGMAYEYMVADQRFASSRPDVLVYQTEPLERDLTVAGPLTATLYVSTSGTDSDWIVKLIDVYPDDYPDPDPNPANVRMGGYQQLVRGEPFRGKFRNSFEKPEPFPPGKVTRVEFALPDVYHVFRRGHRVMVHIQSSWFPLVDRNPQTFMRIHEARESDFRKATQRVCRSRSQPSLVKIGVL
jgi:putative CocE/NonD family hydrolase